MKRPQLPPRLPGVARARWRVSVESLCASDAARRVELTWWGHAHSQSVGVSDGRTAFIDYDVVTSRARFQQYLQDAQKLYFEVLGGAGQSLGYALWEPLHASLDNPEGSRRKLDLFDASGQSVGHLLVGMAWSDLPTVPPRPAYRPPAKHGVATPKPIRKNARKAPARVASTLPEAVDSSSSDSTMTSLPPVVRTSDRKYPPPDKLPQATKTGVSFSADFHDDISGLRRILTRSQDRLAQADRGGQSPTDCRPGPVKSRPEPLKSRPEPVKSRPEPVKSRPEPVKVRPKASDTRPGLTDRLEPLPDDEPPLAPPNRSGGLPSWNLSTCRLHFLSSVNQLQVNLQALHLKPDVFDQLQGTSRPKSAATRLTCGPSASEGSPLSFFISYQVPQCPLPNQYCSRKILGGPHREIAFNQKSTHSTIFKPALLDMWWTANLVFKVHCRALNQRVPTLIGEASIGLKYLLTEARNSDGQRLHLPIYVSHNFAHAKPRIGPQVGPEKDHEPKLTPCSEIAGDVEVAFLLTRSPGSETYRGPQQRPVSPQMAVRDGEMEGGLGGLSPEGDKFPEPSNSRRVPNASKWTSRSLDGCSAVAYLRISEGKGFPKRQLNGHQDSSRDVQPSLFVSSHFFSSDDIIKSSVSWNSDRPQFGLSHYLPVDLNDKFLERCRENYLVAEVWNYAEPRNELIGLSLLPIHQFYLAFQDAERRSVLLGLELPVIAVNDWVGVQSLTTGEDVGQIRVTLAAGSETQIQKLKPLLGLTSDSIVVSEIKASARREFDGLSDHVYDSADTSSRLSPPPSPPRTGSHGGEERISFSRCGDPRDVSQCDAKREATSAPVLMHTNGTSSRSACDAHGRDESAVEIVDDEVKTCQGGEDTSFPPHFLGQIHIEEARNLPRVFDASQPDQRAQPSCYVSFASKGEPGQVGMHSKIVMSNMVSRCRDPNWNFHTQTILSSDLLLDPKRQFILKVWHHPEMHEEGGITKVDPESDHVIGFVAIDLKPLKSGFPIIRGWYNIMDFVGRCRGQICASVKPVEDLSRLFGEHRGGIFNRRDSEETQMRPVGRQMTSYFVRAAYPSFPSHLVQHSEQMISPIPTSSSPNAPLLDRAEYSAGKAFGLKSTGEGSSLLLFSNPNNLAHGENSSSSAQRNPTPQCPNYYWKPPVAQGDLDQASRSLLEMKLSDLDKTTKELKNKLLDDDLRRESGTQSRQSHQGSQMENLQSSSVQQSHEAQKEASRTPRVSELSLQDLQRNISAQLQALGQQTGLPQHKPQQQSQETRPDVASSPPRLGSFADNNGAKRMVSFSEENIQSTTRSSSLLRPLYRATQAPPVGGGELDDVEAEIIELLEEPLQAGAVDEEDSVDLEPFFLPSARHSTLEDLGQIDWGQILSPTEHRRPPISREQ
eukprot:maker-scaffold417_size177606-snap-gene-0.49 protein:Tk07593 transcript:maker-scaffold417_size177606-snap-gene-0.49-mRNA-1 annotation:"hypothetical protein D910_05392"